MPSFAHERARLVIVQVLIALLAPRSLVAEELALMWDPHNLRDHLLPDVMMALDVGEYDAVYGVLRNQYRIWDEGKPPDLVIELASKTTVGRDRLGKKEDYARLEVREYVQFDPLEQYLRPGLQVYRLRGDAYEPAPETEDGAVPSEVLPGYAWLQVGIQLRLRVQATGRLVPTPQEAQAQAEAARAQAEAAQAQAEVERVREAAARQAAEAERAREAEHAAAAMARAQEAEDEVVRLRAEIARLQAGVLPSPDV